jgi:phosphatidylglycerol:prolipoprotein diacylglycerol transferase
MHPILFTWGGGRVSAWDLALLFGLVIPLTWALAARPKDFPFSRLGICAGIALIFIAGFYGSKFMFLALHPGNIKLLSFKIAFRIAGAAFYGALIGELVAILLLAKLRPKPTSFFTIADYATPFLLLQQGILRIGCFLQGCCIGIPTNIPGYGFSFKGEPVLRHPAQLYELVYILAIFFVGRSMYRRGAPRGVTFFATIGLYGFCRFFNEFFRADSFKILGPFTLAEVASISIAIVCGAALIVLSVIRRRQKA